MENSRDLRARLLNPSPVRQDGDYVLYWMLATRRLQHNHALDNALAWCKALNKPLLILEGLRADYRWACARHHRVVLDAMAEHAAECKKRGVRYLPFVERQAGESRGLLPELAKRAAVVVSDDHPGFFFPQALAAAAKQLDVHFEAIDSTGVLPMRLMPGSLPSAYVLRRRMQKCLSGFLDDAGRKQALSRYAHGPARVAASVLKRWPPTPAKQLDRQAALESKIPFQHDVSVSSWQGGALAARATLKQFLHQELGRYDALRMQATPASGLSMALHYGFISSHEVLLATLGHEGVTASELAPRLAAKEAKAKGTRAGFWDLPEQTETFLDQLLTWRELGHRFQAQHPECENWGSQPEWALATLQAHRSDPREFSYTPEQFEAGQTHDPLWNAAQNCLVQEGWMPNYLRMLWGKMLLWWSADPAQAWDTLFHLNNLYALDGRDPNSMSGISWVFGRFDRPFGPERPVIGKLRPMSSKNTARKMDLGDFVERYAGQASDCLDF